MYSKYRPTAGVFWLVILPLAYVVIILAGPWISSPLGIYGGAISQPSGAILPGYATIDPNIGVTSYALGRLAAHELLHGHLPVWNYFEGLGLPLVGEAQSAALLPFTLLLRLPGGQVIEHALFQIIAGLGVLSLLRGLNFSDRTALALAITFEFGSLFVWLKNAMVNPICFLIWLLVFSLWLIKAEPGQRWRADAVGMGLAAGYAVLGGFPESVFIFTLFLLAWTAFYALQARLDGPSLRRLGPRVSLALVIAVLIGSPLLVGLAAFFPVAVVGSHGDPSIAMAHLSWLSALKYLLPYISGPIFAYPVQDEIGSIGGYTGVTLVLLALVGLLATERRAERLFWAASVVLCIGASHGAPIIQDAMMAIPGLKLTAFCRQADVVWIICLILLAAHGLDALPRLTRTRMILAIAGFFGIVVLLVRATARNLIGWAEVPGVHTWLVGSGVAAVFLVLAFTGMALSRRSGIVAGLLISESVLLFLLPVLSLPTVSQIDWGLIDFLRANAGVGRVVNFESNVIQPNFGSALGIRQLNYDDLPIPAATATFIHDRLDPLYPQSATLYLPDFPPTAGGSRRSTYMAEHIGSYRDAGVKYVLSLPDAFGLQSAITAGTNKPLSLASGETLSIRLSVAPSDEARVPSDLSGRLLLRVATFENTSDGDLQIRTCGPDRPCEIMTIPSQDLRDNEYVSVAEHVNLSASGWLDITITKIGGSVPVAVWLYKRAEAVPGGLSISDVVASHPDGEGSIPDLRLSLEATPQVRRVYRGTSGDVYELRNPRSYVAADGCTASLRSFDRVLLECAHPSLLTRLEIWMPGWSALVDGAVTPVTDGGPFQQVAVAAGRHIVSFDYDPYRLQITIILSILTSVMALAGWLWMSFRNVALQARRVRGTRPIM